MDDAVITFIVPLYNEEKSIALCLDSIVLEMNDNDEIIAVDNGSTDRSIEIVRSYPQICLLERPGISIGSLRNVGAMGAKGSILAFIDADCVVCKGWRKAVASSFKDQDVAACGSKYDLPSNGRWIEKAWFSQRKEFAGPVNYINSGNLAVNKHIFVELGGFDGNLVTGEDAEFCWRLKMKGYVVWENPDIKAIHLGNPKNLWNFYKKQRWHGLGMFGTFKISRLDKPVIMTLGFIFCCFFAVSFFVVCIKNVETCSLLLPTFLFFFVPLLTSIFRCFQYQNYAHFLHLVLLYSLYYVARSDALVRIFYSMIARVYTRTNVRS